MSAFDNFNRVDEDPLSGGGNWAAHAGYQSLALKSDQVGIRAGHTESAMSQWQDIQPADVWVEVDVPNPGTSHHQAVMLQARNDGVAAVTAWFYCGRDGTGFPFAEYPTVYLAGRTGSLITGYPTFTFSWGDRMGLRCVGDRLDLTRNGLAIFTETDDVGVPGYVSLGIRTEDFTDTIALDNFRALSMAGLVYRGDIGAPSTFSAALARKQRFHAQVI